MNEALTQKAIEAYKTLSNVKIVIKTELDLTPEGQRRVKLVKHAVSGKKTALQIRWYLGTRAYKTLPLTEENIALSNEWKSIRRF